MFESTFMLRLSVTDGAVGDRTLGPGIIRLGRRELPLSSGSRPFGPLTLFVRLCSILLQSVFLLVLHVAGWGPRCRSARRYLGAWSPCEPILLGPGLPK